MPNVLKRLVPGRILALLGRNGALVMVAAVITGMLLPGMAATTKPWLPVAMSIASLGAFLSASYSVEKSWLQGYVIVIAIWAALVPVILVGLGSGYTGLEAGLLTGIMLATLAPPASSVPTFAALLKLSPKLALAAFVAGTLAAPMTMPALAKAFDIPLNFDPIFYAAKLFAIVGGGWLGATIIKLNLKRLTWLVPEQPAATGIAVCGLFLLFSTSASAARQQWDLNGTDFLRLIAVAAVLNVMLFLIGALVFVRLGYKDALTAGLLTGNRNVGLTWAAAGAGIPIKTEAYLAASLVIIALMPVTFQQTVRLVNALSRRPARRMIDVVWSELGQPLAVQSRALAAGGKYRIGRGIDSDIFLLAPTVSRLHAELAIDADGGVTVRDLGSKNGLLFKGARVPEIRIGPNDTVQVGTFLIGLGTAHPVKAVAEWCEIDPPGPLHEKVLAGGGTYTIGRSPDADIVLPSAAVSGIHAQLSIDPAGEATVTDRGSTNGLLVQGLRLREVRLGQKVGESDSVQIGTYHLRIRPAPECEGLEDPRPTAVTE